MKPLAPFLLLLALALPVRADLTIVSVVKSEGDSTKMTMKIKDGKSLVEVAPGVSTILDADSGDSITIMHSQKKYMKIPGSSTRALLEQIMGKKNVTPAAPPKLVATGEKEKISGHETERYTSESGSMKTEYWFAPDYPDYNELLDELARFQKSGLGMLVTDNAPSPKSFPGFPMRTRAVVNGKTVLSTVQSISRDKVDGSEFEPPADYEAMDLPFGNLGK